jgi:ectoine hydroxylase-related dioxygenase (phytanoyl-CoA dioxygenase family)
MLTPEQEERFQRDGYVLGGRVLDDAEVYELRAEIMRVIDDRDNDGVPQPVLLKNLGKPETPIWQVVNISEASAPFRKLVHNPEIAGSIARLMDAAEVRLWHDQIQYKPASTGGVNMWHQDAPYWPTLTPMTQVTAWIALDDVDIENGCMSMVPGSHRWGNNIEFLHTLKSFDAMPAEFDGHAVDVRVCPVKKGHVHFHHALTWHGSSANTSGRPRRAIALHYMGNDTRFVANGNHVMKPFISVADGDIIAGDRFPLVWPK